MSDYPTVTKSFPTCSTDNASWGWENGNYCVSASFCPTARQRIPVASIPNTPRKGNATTTAVYQYLLDNFGQKTLSGQADLTWFDAIDMSARVFADTGEYPALMGYDFMNYGMTADWVQGINQTEEAIDYWNAGGLVTFAWHWRDPSKLNTSDVNKAAFYTTDKEWTDFRAPVKNGALDTANPSYSQINAGIDLIAEELKTLRDAGVTVLWRPLHEASGGWFWWGAKRTDSVPPAFAQILLWRHMFTRLTEHHGLDNLIWVWNGQDISWYPGDDYVDIVTQDIYASDHSAQLAKFNETQRYSFEKKMVALSENGRIPDPTAMYQDGATWLWFMTWNDTNDEASADNFWSKVNSLSLRQSVYAHERVINRGDLPNFRDAN